MIVNVCQGNNIETKQFIIRKCEKKINITIVLYLYCILIIFRARSVRNHAENKKKKWRKINDLYFILMITNKISFLIHLPTKANIYIKKFYVKCWQEKKSTNLYLATILRIFHIFCEHWSICHAFISHSGSVNKPSKFAVGSSSTVINNRKLPIYPQQISSINLSCCHTERHSWSDTKC